jgi:hypothetical protein
LAILVIDPFAFLEGAKHVKCRTSYTTKKYVSQVLKKMNPCDMQWNRKAWSKLLEYSKIQVLMSYELASTTKIIEGTCIITNLSII